MFNDDYEGCARKHFVFFLAHMHPRMHTSNQGERERHTHTHTHTHTQMVERLQAQMRNEMDTRLRALEMRSMSG